MEPDSSAQETATGPDGQAPETADIKDEGIRKRIGQVVGEREAQRRRADQLEAQLQQAIATATQTTETMARMAERIHAPAQPAEPAEPEIEIDPEEVKKFQYMTKKVMGPVLAELEGIKRSIYDTRVELAATEGSRKVANYGLNAEQLGRARAIFDKMHKSGVSEWSMQDSVRQILGEATEAQLLKRQETDARRSRMNGTHTLPFQGGAPGVGGGPSIDGTQPDELPKNFDQLPPKEQMKLLNKRGVHNKGI